MKESPLYKGKINKLFFIKIKINKGINELL